MHATDRRKVLRFPVQTEGEAIDLPPPPQEPFTRKKRSWRAMGRHPELPGPLETDFPSLRRLRLPFCGLLKRFM